jgi:hypothetical protein
LCWIFVFETTPSLDYFVALSAASTYVSLRFAWQAQPHTYLLISKLIGLVSTHIHTCFAYQFWHKFVFGIVIVVIGCPCCRHPRRRRLPHARRMGRARRVLDGVPAAIGQLA